MNQAMLAAGSEQPGEVFGITKHVGGEIDGLQFVRGGTSEKLEKRGIGGEERAFQRDTEDAVNGIFDEFAAASFAFFQLKPELRIHVAKLLAFDSALQGDRKTRQTIFQNVVRHTVLRAFDGIFFGEDAGDQKKRSVVAGLAQVRESVKTSPAGERVSSEDRVKLLRVERGFKVRALFQNGGQDGNAGVAQFAKNRSGVVRGMLKQQNAERRNGQRRFELFGRSGFHGRDPGEWDCCKAAQGQRSQ